MRKRNNPKTEGEAIPIHSTSYSYLPRISENLTEVLDAIGLSEEHRQDRLKLGVMWQMLENISIAIDSGGKLCNLRMGSRIEGTTADGMGSDEDVLHFLTSLKAYCNKDNTNQTLNLVFTRDETTPAGYTMLQPAYQGCIINDPSDKNLRCDLYWHLYLKVDSTGRLMIAHFANFSLADFKHGPAETWLDMPNSFDKDFVRSILCNDTANEMDEWCQRDRLHDWPTKVTRDLFKTLGCFVVPVGHPSSPVKHLEWRISFSLQERHLMRNLNPTQYHCFMLLKLIKTFMIKPRFGDVLTSYHCKTVLFYTIETHEQGIWVSENLIVCLRMCLILLQEWIVEKNIPNYFIPKENMFVKMQAALLQGNYHNLKSCLTDMIDGWTFLFCIKFNGLGDLFRARMNGKQIQLCISETVHVPLSVGVAGCIKHTHFSDYRYNLHELQHTLGYLDIVLAVLQSSRPCTSFTTFDENIQDLYKQWFDGRGQNQDKSGRARQLIESYMFQVEENERQHRLVAVMIWKSELLTWLGSAVAAQYFQTGNIQYLLKSDTCCELGKSLKAMASMLIKATVLLKQSLCDASGAVLNVAEVILKDKITSCQCYYCAMEYSMEGVKKMIPHIWNRNTFSNAEDFSNYISESCLNFKICEYDILPESLTFEAYRSFGISIGSLPLYERLWCHSVTMDPVMYLYYLQFLNNQHNNPGESAVALHKFQTTLFERLRARHSSALGHTDTWLNVLGDIFVKKGWIRLALRCFKYSDRIRPNHNAVRWHIMFLLFSPSDGVMYTV